MLHEYYVNISLQIFIEQKRKNARTKPVLPYFKSLGDEAAAQKQNLLSAMFNVTIDLFLPGGELRAVLEQFALALLRHDAEARKVLGPYNRISGLLKRAARRANIFDSRFPSDPSLPRICPTLLIQKWGGIIQQDFVTRLAISCRHAEGELDTPVAPLHSGMSNVEGMMKKMLDNQNRILDENVALRAQVQLLSTEVVYLRKGLQYSNQRLQSIDNGNLRLSSILKSPDKVVSSSAVESPPSFPSFDKPGDEASEEGLKQSAHPVALMKQTSSLSDSATLPLLHTHPINPLSISLGGTTMHSQSVTQRRMTQNQKLVTCY